MSEPEVPMSDLIERLAAAAVEVRGLITEAHKANKDLRATLAEARDFLSKDIRTEIENTVTKQVTTQLEKMGEQIREAMDKAVEKVGREFNKLADIYLTGSGSDKGPLPVAAERAREAHVKHLGRVTKST